MALTTATWVGQSSNSTHNSSLINIDDIVPINFTFNTNETYIGDNANTVGVDESADDTVTFTIGGVTYTNASFEVVKEGLADSGNGGSGGTQHAYIEIEITSGPDAGSTYIIVTDGSDPSKNPAPEGLFKTGNHNATTDGDLIALCFVSGTMIECAKGQIAVENLREGDWVKTVSSGNKQISWIGSTKRSSKNGFLPIRFKAGSLGDNMPERELLVSPDHRMVISGPKAELLFGEESVLVAAKSLVNDDSITVAYDLETFEYFHLMFDKHEIVLANGTASESFHAITDSLNALEKSSRDEILALFPEIGMDSYSIGSALPEISKAESALLAI